MAKFKIKIEQEFVSMTEKYPTHQTLYEQTVEEIDIPAIVSVINKLNDK